MTFESQKTIGALDSAQKLYFYQLLAHFLTVQMRGILFFEGIADSERVDRAKWLNEIAHRITYKVFALHKNLFEWSDADIWGMIEQKVSKNPALENAVNAAIELSHEYLVKSEI